MSPESGQLLLRQNATVTCPKCSNEFSLDQGFAKKALEQLSEASAGAIASMRDAERAEVEKRAQQLASEQARAAQGVSGRGSKMGVDGSWRLNSDDEFRCHYPGCPIRRSAYRRFVTAIAADPHV
jgi:hypothetical protein